MTEKLEPPEGYVFVCIHCAKEIGITLDSQSGNNDEDTTETEETLPKGKELSDEEIETIMYKCDWSYDPVSFARAIIKASRGEE